MRYFIVLIGMPLLQILTAHLFRLLVPETNSFLMTYCQIFLQQFVSVCVPVFILFRKKKYFSKEEFMVSKPGYFLRCIWLGLLLQFIGIAVNFPISALLQHFGFPLPHALPKAETLVEFLIQTVVACLTPAVFEEVLFRRMVYGTIEEWSTKAAVIFSALFFAMAHFDFHNFAATMTVGLCLGMLRYRGAPLILCITTHFFVNFSASILNIILEIPIVASLVERYYLLIVFLAIVLFAASFPKKISSSLEEIPNSTVPTQKHGWYHMLTQPLFYLYLVIFFVLGVKNL